MSNTPAARHVTGPKHAVLHCTKHRSIDLSRVLEKRGILALSLGRIAIQTRTKLTACVAATFITTSACEQPLLLLPPPPPLVLVHVALAPVAVILALSTATLIVLDVPSWHMRLK
uniref:3-hydroxydecanoyl-[acyl-carrier-protein] dehydratase n=1 Tax=Lygus hesperus TaxID=30085 RepID=A0A0A9Y5E4_LYGHE